MQSSALVQTAALDHSCSTDSTSDSASEGLHGSIGLLRALYWFSCGTQRCRCCPTATFLTLDVAAAAGG
jgi:hypothetical protein